jgi:dTDP-4-amino-4,6-dideoxygalactose transaminase
VRAAVFHLPRAQTEDFSQSLRASLKTLSLPIYPELAESQLQYVVDTIAALFRS